MPGRKCTGVVPPCPAHGSTPLPPPAATARVDASSRAHAALRGDGNAAALTWQRAAVTASPLSTVTCNLCPCSRNPQRR
eukprot:362982-Chlamydomonas_euryale.AAC.5